jgi:hypothetical protein
MTDIIDDLWHLQTSILIRLKELERLSALRVGDTKDLCPALLY